MPSKLHESFIEIFRHRPSLAAELLESTLGVDLPAYEQVRLEPADFPDLAPTEYRADAVTVLTAGGQATLAVVVEVQLSRDRAKRWTWPVYVATLRARLRCPTVLLVVCSSASVANWCATPIELGHPGWTLRPLVLGPDRVPVVTDAGDAERSPELAVLSAMTHSTHPDRDKILSALLSGLASVDRDLSALYSDLVYAALPAAARRYLEVLVRKSTAIREYHSDFVRGYVFQGRAEGRIEGRADAVLTVLEARGIGVGAEHRARILDCGDIDQLETWLRRAVTADSIGDLFD